MIYGPTIHQWHPIREMRHYCQNKPLRYLATLRSSPCSPLSLPLFISVTHKHHRGVASAWSSYVNDNPNKLCIGSSYLFSLKYSPLFSLLIQLFSPYITHLVIFSYDCVKHWCYFSRKVRRWYWTQGRGYRTLPHSNLGAHDMSSRTAWQIYR